MNYNLNTSTETTESAGLIAAFKKLLPLLETEKTNLAIAAIAIAVNTTMNLLAPIVVGRAVDKYILTGKYSGVLWLSAALLGMYIVALLASYFQTRVMGGVGQRVLFNLRNAIFTKLQDLPVAFFNQNKAGDLISRINNDTDKLNQFFSQSLMQLVGSIFIMIGSAISLVSLHPKLGIAALMPAAIIIVFTQFISAWVKRKNAANLKTVGGMSAEIQQSLENFKVIVAFNRSDYFRQQFDEVNKQNYNSAISAGLANNVFAPLYSLASMAGQLIVLAYGIFLIQTGNFSLGLLISFFTFVMRFYDPLRQLATLWSSFQVALAGWDRVSEILSLENDLIVIPEKNKPSETAPLISFKDVSFAYPNGTEILHHINFSLEQGKTYALVGPTGGGKTTTASLMARLYDPIHGEVLLRGQDIRMVSNEERTKKIGFILQEPFLFSGTVKENILYGNNEYKDFSNGNLEKAIHDADLETLLTRFDQGLDTKITAVGDSMSLGQKQLIAFMRAVLRNPELLILDEATANVDTVTEQLLEDILKKLPKSTTKVIIAHRLNTIANADEIFFVNAGEIIRAGSMEHAVEMLMHGKRQS
jgi:ATP-binding cassette subfamily B protein